MGAALALAIMLVVVVGILSLAVNAQGPFQGGASAGGTPPRPARSSHPGAAPPASPGPERPPRRAPRERNERSRERQSGAPVPSPVEEPGRGAADLDPPGVDVKPLKSQAQAFVVSVVDERTLGPVTRSRLTLRVEPAEGASFEVTTRVAFPTPADRARIKVGATIPVRYDANDHRRVVVDMDRQPGE